MLSIYLKISEVSATPTDIQEALPCRIGLQHRTCTELHQQWLCQGKSQWRGPLSVWDMDGMNWGLADGTYRDGVESRVQWPAGGHAMLQETPDTLQAYRSLLRIE